MAVNTFLTSNFSGKSETDDRDLPAVTPDQAAKSLIEFIDKFDMEKTGQYWAPRGSE